MTTQNLIKTLATCEAEARLQIAAASGLAPLQELKSHHLGKKGRLTQILKALAQLSPEERKGIGKLANDVKQALTAAFEARASELSQGEVNQRLAAERVDVTLNGLPHLWGSRHPVLAVMAEMQAVFRRLGFDVCEGPEIETDWYNFAALNIPENHPARDMQDTFYLEDGRLLRTHTSPVQIHVMEGQKPPIAMVAPGVVYRRDSDLTHTPMFHQLEALYVDTGTHFGHLKAVIKEFLQGLFGKGLQTQFRPSFFPFTEPSAEVDMGCVFCQGKGCRVCKNTGWLEIMGCGMVDPAVFKAVNIDSARFTGFAFGVGVERVTMLKYGIHDLRWFFENDVRFLAQF